jgi:hypothetical protein
VGRAIVELFVIDTSNPASYRQDWGGPGLVGVLLVHCGPGILAVAPSPSPFVAGVQRAVAR